VPDSADALLLEREHHGEATERLLEVIDRAQP
jgi:hypothetical protein